MAVYFCFGVSIAMVYNVFVQCDDLYIKNDLSLRTHCYRYNQDLYLFEIDEVEIFHITLYLGLQFIFGCINPYQVR